MFFLESETPALWAFQKNREGIVKRELING